MTNRPPLAMLFLFCLFITPGVAADDRPTLSTEELAWLAAHGPIRYAPDPAYPPFESVDDNATVTGINMDLLNRMSRNLGFEFEPVIYDNWTAVLDAMRAGEVDLLGSLAKTDERAEYMDFVGPYMSVGEVFYVRDDNPADRIEDLVGQRIGVIPSYAAAQWLADNHPEYTTVPVENTRDGLHKLSVGEIDAFFENIPVAADIIRRDALTNVRILGEPLYFSEANWGVRKDDAVLTSIIEKAMHSISPGEQTRVFEYWSGYDLGVTQVDPGVAPWLRNTLLGLGITTVAVGLWSVSLRRTVNHRTKALRESREEVLALNASLEARVDDRTRALRHANRSLESFSYTISHDLKTPLTAITSYNHVLAAKYADRLDDDGRSIIARSSQAAERMAQMIADVLRLSQVARADIQREDIDASAVAKDILRSLRDGHPDQTFEATVQPGITIHADRALLTSVLSNLLENAWKYSRGAKPPTITVGAEVRDGRTVCFVRDNGIGFSPDDAEAIFEPFKRADSTKDYEGTGIGLSTVLRAVERHGGTVWAKSTPGAGATFYVDFGPEAA